MSLSGHLWTLGPTVTGKFRPAAAPAGVAWSTPSRDARGGEVLVTGAWHPRAGARRALVLVHGLGGSIDSGYLRHAAREAWERDFAVLRLNLRGSDRSGADLYHAGLTVDIDAALASPELAGFDDVDLWGFSLGGHVVLRWAATTAAATSNRSAGRGGRVVAVCSPLQLARGADALDRGLAVYRLYLLLRLNELVDAAHRRGLRVPPARALKRVRSIRQWDGLVVGPYFGFRDAEDYYTQASVAPLLHQIDRPTLIVHSTGDPMVPIHTVRPALQNLSATTTSIVTTRGGHVGFPADLDLGLGPNQGIRGQVLDWLTDPRNQ